MGTRSISETAVVSKLETYKKLLSKLECPFTWDMDFIDDSIEAEYNHKDTKPSLPLQKLLRAIMMVFVKIKRNEIERIEDELEKSDEYFDTLKNSADPEISHKVAKAVLQATKCFVYLELNEQKKLDLLLNDLENLDNMDNKEKSTLWGCQSICWSKYRRLGSCKAEQSIRKAIELNGNCSLWHFLLGKIIRHQRRTLSIAGKPGDEEANSFLTAYKILKNPPYKIFVAQMHQERKEFDEASKLYEELYEESFDSLNTAAVLRLALGFIKQGQLEKAKVGLDKAEKSSSKRSMYSHYKAKYHIKNKEISKASRFFKEAIKHKNFAAELEYFKYMLHLSKTQGYFNATKYLVIMILDKYYESLPETQLQSVILHIAFSYLNREKDEERAIEYFLWGIKIDPKAKCLTEFYNNDIFYRVEDGNVYLSLENRVLPNLDYQHLDEATIEKVDVIQEICRANSARNNVA